MAFGKAIQQLLLTQILTQWFGWVSWWGFGLTKRWRPSYPPGPISSTTAEKKIEKIINNNKSNTYLLTYLLTYILFSFYVSNFISTIYRKFIHSFLKINTCDWPFFPNWQIAVNFYTRSFETILYYYMLCLTQCSHCRFFEFRLRFRNWFIICTKI